MRIYCIMISSVGLLINLNPTFAQDKVQENLSSAKSAYQSKNYEDTRYALQQSLSELDVVIGKEILKTLPTELGEFASKPENDQVMGNAMGVTGLNVSREYKASENPEQYIDLTILNNSPMLAGITSFLTNPLFMNTADESQKSVKVQSYKAVLQKGESGNETPTYGLQIPVAQSLVTMNFNDFDNESEVLRLANMIDLAKVAELLK